MVQAVRGMRDVLPVEALQWRVIEDQVRAHLRSFAYEEVQLPLLEYTDLFARGVGEATDIVEKEMYSLNDRDGDSLTLRPEGTASCVRALQEHGLLYNQVQRVFYAGPMFRYEKPQKGRFRQFYQIGAEAFGMAGPDVDVELIVLCAQIWSALGVLDHVRLELNTLGDKDARQAYRQALVEYLSPLQNQLDEDSQRRLSSNPLRILDSKSETTQALLVDAPALPDFVDQDSRNHFETLCEALQALGVDYVHNPKLVRGLDYYTHTVFEWVTDDLGSQGTICAGGRYDGLVERLGGKPTPAVGFAMGLDRVLLLHQVVHQAPPPNPADAYLCCLAGNPPSTTIQTYAFEVANITRRSGVLLRQHMGGGNLKKQLKRADAIGAQWALMVGEQEMLERKVTLKELATGEQSSLDLDQLAVFFSGL
ncbi:MAG: histidine--tRNA ligase [Pseudomonadota bacterium]